jgi:hypothetical protein
MPDSSDAFMTSPIEEGFGFNKRHLMSGRQRVLI